MQSRKRTLKEFDPSLNLSELVARFRIERPTPEIRIHSVQLKEIGVAVTIDAQLNLKVSRAVSWGQDEPPRACRLATAMSIGYPNT
jgi:hypothetical protein